MGEALLGIVTQLVLKKLISLTNEGISGLMGVNEDLQRLTEQFEMIQGLLSDAERKSTTNKAIEIWLKRLENASIDADDLLDEIAYHQVVKKKIPRETKEKVCIFFSSSYSLLFRFKMVSKIKKIILEIEDIYKTANQIGLRAVEIMNFPTDPRKVELTDPFVDTSEIIGREDDLRKVINHLLISSSKDEKKNLSVMGIVGMPGQGKTTLAKLLIKQDEIKKNFNEIIWTCVSTDFDVERILKDMLQSLTGEASQLHNRKAIVEKLSKELQGKRFLLVLDDVWNEIAELWDCMKNCLQSIGGSKGSKIVVTTRSEVVVTRMGGFPYPLGVLSKKHSQELFERIAFGSGEVMKTYELVKIGERIVGRCGGVPLALKTIGGLMSSQRDEFEWRKIEESNVWNSLDNVRSAIRLSFDHLPFLSIKQCFIYCSIFPKDSTLKKDDLIQQWMAHGLLNPSRESELEMEVVGKNYFKILLQRSFLQEPESDDLFGNIISCKMHDLVHDFASEISKGRCLNIVNVGQLSNYNIMNVVHLRYEGGDKTYSNKSKINFLRLRTLYLIGHENFVRCFLEHCQCKNLCVLTIDSDLMEELPISITKMKRLRYLDITKTGISGSLPEFVSMFYNMQTLKVNLIKSLPKKFSRLFDLRHLNIIEGPAIHRDHFVPWISKFNHLRTLNCFPISRQNGCHIDELCHLNNLEGSLQVAGLENVANQDATKTANLSLKRYIESLVLVWDRINEKNTQVAPNRNDQSVIEGLQPHPSLKALSIENFMGKLLPSWISTLQNLMRLKLFHLEECEKIPPLGHLPFLKSIDIFNMPRLKYITKDFYGWSNLVIPSTDSSHRTTSCSSTIGGFPSLVELKVSGLGCLEEWSCMILPSFLSSSSSVAFPSLKYIYISYCPSLSYLPDSLFRSTTSLEGLFVNSCQDLVSIPNMSNFLSLKELEISGCPKLQVIPLGINACTSLRELTIEGPASLIQSLVLPYLTNLKGLMFFLSSSVIDPYNNYSTSSSSKLEPNFSSSSSSNVEELGLYSKETQLKSLPEQIQHFTSLRSLTILLFDGLETIPEWVGKFHSLEILDISGCKSLANFPSKEVMYSLTNLNYLSIIGCPILAKRCNEETGAEWHKIAHIPKIMYQQRIW